MHVVPVQLVAGTLDETDSVPLPLPLRVSVSGWSLAENVAITLRAWSIFTVHVPVAFVQAPVQPANCAGAVGVAVSTMLSLKLNAAWHVPGQSIAAGCEVTRPVALPAVDTVSVC